MTAPHLGLTLRLHTGADIAIGPGKADLLAAIEVQGSIAAAARAMGLSYRRAWLMVETMNRSFARPLVAASKGGGGGGGTVLTIDGAAVLAAYRAMVAAAATAAGPQAAQLMALLR
jgi:molybdate transport system regulatory protein